MPEKGTLKTTRIKQGRVAMTGIISISARRLAEYVHRSGSIDARIGSSTALLEGTKIHQAVQKNYADTDEKEVYLERKIEVDGNLFQLEGRCDGLLSKEDQLIIDEIKSTSRSLQDIDEPSPVHLAQAAVYAWIVCETKGLERIDIQMTYVQTITKEERRFIQVCTAESLRRQIEDMIRLYAPFAMLMKNLLAKRNESIQSLTFPHAEFRQGQRKFAGAVYQTINEKGKLFAQAPTGIGKTISALFPSVKSLGEEKANHLIYSTAKTITRTAAEEAFSRMADHGLQMSSVTLTAKDKICFQEKTICQKEYCEFADGHYDRINAAIMDILENEQQMTRPVIEQYARKHRVCPFEYSMDLSYLTDAMIGDYNYVFDPRVARKRLAGEQKRSTVLLVDEAHNLVDRAREMYSATIQKAPFLALSKSDADPLLKKAAKKVNRACLDIKKSCGENPYVMLEEIPPEWKDSLLPFYEQAEEQVKNGAADETIIDLYFAAQRMLHVIESMDERFYVLVEKRSSDVIVKVICMDPSLFIKETTKSYRASVFFSATLAPVQYVRKMLGGESTDYGVAIPSPFNKEQIDVRVYPISTKYRDREYTIKEIVHAIKQGIEDAQGNFIVFFPSYRYMQSAVEEFQLQVEPGRYELLIQSINMSEEEREAFLQSFKKEKRNIVAFAVMGGVFSEGVDLPGNQLSGVAVIGVGLPQLNPERDQMKKYFQRQGQNGYHYAYVYPGINKVLQAGGRLIRTETDHGILLLIDDRFQTSLYQQLLPEEWRGNKSIQNP